MATNKMIIKRGAPLYPVGFPIITVTLDLSFPRNRRSEYCIFLFGWSKGVSLIPKRFVYHNIDDSIISDQVLMSETLEASQCELDMYLQDKREEFQKSHNYTIPFTARFILEETTNEILRFYLIQREQEDLVNKVRNSRLSDELKAIMPNFPSHNRWVIEPDNT